MAIHKEKLLKASTGFTQVSNKVVNDRSISLKAKGLFIYLYAKPDSWEFSSERMADDLSEGTGSIQSGLRELEEAGYLRRRKLPSGKITYFLTFNKPKPQNPVQAQEPILENPRQQKPLSAETEGISNKEVISNKEKEVIKSISPEGEALKETAFSLTSSLRSLAQSEDKKHKIVALYLRWKKLNLENWKQFKAEVGRNMKIAKSLEGYSSVDITRTLSWCEENYGKDYVTLETCAKRIALVTKSL